MPEDNDLLAKRREAKLALGGERIAEKEKLTEKRRQEAILAMEGELGKMRRETKESVVRASGERERATVEATAKAEAEARAAASRAEAERLAKEKTIFNARVEREQKAKQDENLTGKLRGTATKLSAIRTIKTDMARAVKEEGLSLSKIATIAQNHKQTDETIISHERSSFWLIISIIIMLAGSGGLIAWWWITQQQASAPTVMPVSPPAPVGGILRADEIRKIEAARLNSVGPALEALEKAATKVSDQKPEIISLVLTKNGETLPLVKFGETLGLNLPDNLILYLRDNFFFGIYESGETQSRFLILQTSFLDRAATGLQDWERYLASDLEPILKTSSDNRADWHDGLLRNKNVRIEREPNGKAIVVYGFLDQQTILITPDENTFIKVFERLINQI